MRYDRWGDPIEDEEGAEAVRTLGGLHTVHTLGGEKDVTTADTLGEQHRCDHGWLGEDDHGRPIPCLICRPHLTHLLQRGGR